MDDSQPTSESLFRATKRQKIWRKRAGSEDLDSLENEFAPVSHDVKTPDDTDAAQLPKQNSTIAEILRRRKLGKAQKAGIAFTNSSTVKAQDVEAPTESGGEVVSSSDTAYGRFAPQTGQQVTDGSDKHM